MAIGIPGIDTTSVAGQTILRAATSLLGTGPAFWGRYFHAKGRIDAAGKFDTVNYSKSENAFLHAHGIRLLPIARQTAKVGGDEAAGRADARTNVEALFEALSPSYLYGADPDVLVFLDVETANPMTEGYWVGWSSELVQHGATLSSNKVSLHPALYVSQANNITFHALTKALANGSVCAGLWIARYFHDVCAPPQDWDATLVTPGVHVNVPVLAWQYTEKCGSFDPSQANPAYQDELLKRLPLPPG